MFASGKKLKLKFPEFLDFIFRESGFNCGITFKISCLSVESMFFNASFILEFVLTESNSFVAASNCSFILFFFVVLVFD